VPERPIFACLLVHLDHVVSLVVNTNHGIM
jgi:hypothetical protein